MLSDTNRQKAIKHVKDGQKTRPGNLHALCEEALRQVGTQPTEQDVKWLKDQVLGNSPARQVTLKAA